MTTKCPRCGNEDVKSVEGYYWEHYCPKCDVKFRYGPGEMR